MRFEQKLISTNDGESDSFQPSQIIKNVPSNPPFGRPNKLIKDMTYDEAFQAKKYYELIGDRELVVKCLERMLITDQDAYTLKVARLDLAKAYEIDAKYEKSLQLYEEFTQLYPGSAECEEALYKSIKINYILTPDFRHDQSKTLKTIELADEFLEEENKFTVFKNEVEDLKQESYEKLCDNNIYISEQYLNQFAYTEIEKDLNAARHRLEFAKKKYLPHAETKSEAFSLLETKIKELEDNVEKNKKITHSEVEDKNDEAAPEKPDFTSHF